MSQDLPSDIKTPWIDLGNRLFRWRRWFYLIPIGFLLIMNPKKFQYPRGQFLLDEIIELLSFTILLVGLSVRMWASGTSYRSFRITKAKPNYRFQTKGIFSLIRNPYFLGDLLVIVGLSIPLFDLFYFALSLLLFITLYYPILFARDQILLYYHRNAYSLYCSKVHSMIPAWRQWQTSRVHFRWILALQKEGGVLVAAALLFYFVEQYREIMIKQCWTFNPLWLILILPFVVLWFFIRSQDRDLPKLPDTPEWPE